jgi:adhesin/invasin
MIRARTALAAVALAVSLGCTGDEGGVGNVLVVASVEVTPGITTVILGGTTQLTAAPKTASGLPVPGRSVTWSSTDPAKATVSQTGVVTGLNLGGPVRIRATVEGITGDALITVQPVPVHHVTVTPNDTPILVGGTIQLTATAFDANNAPLSGRRFDWESSAPGNAAVTSTGMVIGQSEGGPVTITATTEGKSGSATVSVSTRPATRLAFATQPGPSTAGAPFNPQIRIALQDDLLTTVIGANNPVTIQLVGNPTGATLGGTLTVSPINGITTFGNLTINRVGTGYILLATSTGLVSATSLPFNVSVGAPAQFTFITAPPAAAQSGAPLSPQPALQLVDASGNVVPQANVQVTATIASGAGTLGGTATVVTNAQGAAAFSNLAIVGAAGNYTLSFAAPGITSLVSGPIVLGSGAAAALSITTQPSPTGQNAVPLAQQPAVQLRDGVGNPVPQAGVVVTASLASGTGTLGGATSATTDASGLATFTSLAINGSAGVYTLRFSAPGAITPVVSSSITLGAGVASRVAVTVQPGSPAQVGVPFSPPPAAQLRDASNNPVAAAGVTITASASAGGTLLGTTGVTTNGTGTATFSGLALSGPVGSYTLTFSAPSLQAGTSNTITLNAGAASQLSITTQPSAGAASGVGFAQQPVIQVRDIAGNPVGTTPGVTVTAALASGPAGTLGGTLTATTTAAGVASFNNLAITGPSGSYTIRFTAPGLTQVVSNTVTLGSGSASTIAANSPATQSAVAGSAVAAPPSVVVLDASANPVAGVPVTFAVTAGGGTVVPAGPATVLTNASGIATATSWTLGPAAGTNNNTVTASAPVPTGSPVTFTASGLVGPPASIAANSVTSQSATVSTAVASPPSVLVRDANNNPVQGVNVTFTLTGGGGGIVPASPAVVPTNAQGIATLTSWTVGPSAGTNNNTVSATAAVPSGSPVLFTASGTAAGAGSIAANSSTSQTATVATAVAAPPSVRVTDALGNPVALVNVTFTLTAGGGSISPASPAVIATNGSGIATLTSWTLGTAAGSNNNTVTATASGVPGVITFTSSATAGAANTVAANSPTNQSAPVGTAVGAPPSVRVTDQFGNPVTGFAVSFAVTSGGGTVVPAAPATVLTNAAGIATATSWTLGPGVGANTVNATAGALNGSPVVFTATGTAGGATNIAANSVTTQSAVAGTAVAAPPSVRVTDASSNPVSGQAVTFTIVDGGNGSVGAPATVLTDGNGIATVASWTLRTVAGTNNNTLHATSGSLIGSPVIFTASGTVGPAALMTANSVTSQSATVATAAVPPSVRVTDANNNPVVGFGVTFTVTAAATGGTITPASPATVPTNGSGIATLTSWTLGTSAGTNNNTVSASGVGAPLTFNASGVAGSANTIAANSATTQSASPNTNVAAPPSVLVTDTHGNPVASFAVTFTLTAGGGSIAPASPASVSTNSAGVATLTSWTLGPTVGTNNNTVSATAALSGSPIIFNASATAGAATTIAANSVTTQSGTVATAVAAPPSVRVTDAGGNPVTGVSVTFTVTAGGGLIVPSSPATVITDGSGIATLTSWTLGNTAGANTVTAASGTLGGSPVTFNATGTAGAATNIAANSTTSQSAETNTNVAAPPSVLVTDTHGNPVSGFAVTFTLTAGGGSIAPASPTSVNTNSAGVATLTNWTLGPTVGTNNNTVSATAALTGSPVIFNASGTAAPATTIAANSVTTQSGTVATAVAAPPSVIVTDGGGNPVSGVSVTFTVTAGGGSIVPSSPATVVTDGSGIATLTSWTLGNTAGANTVTAASGTLTGSPVTFNATGTAGAATNIAATSATTQSAEINSNVAAPPSVIVTDTHGNPVAGESVVFAVATGGGTIVPAAPATIMTNASGIASLTSWTLGNSVGSNNNSVTATSGTLIGSPVTFTASATAGPAANIVANSATTQTGTAGANVGDPPAVLVTDANGNPRAGVSVVFAVASGGGSISPAGPATVITAGSGVATLTSWTLGTTAGTNNNSVTATSGSLVGSPVTFTASGLVGAAAVIVITQQPGPAPAVLGEFSPQPAIKVTDAFGNGVAGVSVTVSLDSGSGTLTGTVTVVTDGSGDAAYTSLGLLAGGSGNHRLRFSASGVPDTLTPPF